MTKTFFSGKLFRDNLEVVPALSIVSISASLRALSPIWASFRVLILPDLYLGRWASNQSAVGFLERFRPFGIQVSSCTITYYCRYRYVIVRTYRVVLAGSIGYHVLAALSSFWPQHDFNSFRNKFQKNEVLVRIE